MLLPVLSPHATELNVVGRVVGGYFMFAALCLKSECLSLSPNANVAVCRFPQYPNPEGLVTVPIPLRTVLCTVTVLRPCSLCATNAISLSTSLDTQILLLLFHRLKLPICDTLVIQFSDRRRASRNLHLSTPESLTASTVHTFTSSINAYLQCLTL